MCHPHSQLKTGKRLLRYRPDGESSTPSQVHGSSPALMTGQSVYGAGSQKSNHRQAAPPGSRASSVPSAPTRPGTKKPCCRARTTFPSTPLRGASGPAALHPRAQMAESWYMRSDSFPRLPPPQAAVTPTKWRWTQNPPAPAVTDHSGRNGPFLRRWKPRMVFTRSTTSAGRSVRTAEGTRSGRTPTPPAERRKS